MTGLKNFPIGMSDFAEVIEHECTFIDKTMLIKEIIDDKAKIILITRPRRFGKTLAMSMLEAFLSIKGPDVFKGLKILNETNFCARHHK